MLNTNQSMKIILCGDWWALDYTWEAFYLTWGPNPYVEKQLMAQAPPKFTEIYNSRDWSANSEHYTGLSAIYWNSVHTISPIMLSVGLGFSYPYLDLNWARNSPSWCLPGRQSLRAVFTRIIWVFMHVLLDYSLWMWYSFLFFLPFVLISCSF